MIHCNCEFDYHCEPGVVECGCGACLANDAFIRLNTWEEQKEAFNGIAALLGKNICSFLSGLDYAPAGVPEVSRAEWNRIVTGKEVIGADEQWEPTTVNDVLSRFCALDAIERELAWQNINTFMHHVVDDEQDWAEPLASGGAR